MKKTTLVLCIGILFALSISWLLQKQTNGDSKLGRTESPPPAEPDSSVTHTPERALEVSTRQNPESKPARLSIKEWQQVFMELFTNDTAENNWISTLRSIKGVTNLNKEEALSLLNDGLPEKDGLPEILYYSTLMRLAKLDIDRGKV